MDIGYKFPDGKELFYEHCIIDVGETRVGKRHYHRLFEVYYFVKGECNYFIDGHTYTLLPGDLIFIPENVIHRTLYTSNYERRLLNFTSHFLPDNITQIPHLYRNPATATRIKSIFEEIDRNYNGFDAFSEESLVCLIKSLFILVLRSDNRANEKFGASFVAEAVKRIDEDFHTDITLSAMAEMLSITPEHLSRTFKKETGFGFNEYLTLVRLKRAEEMLKGDKSVSEIAYACGFNDSNYFSDKFKHTYGVSPLKFRKRNNI